MLGALSLAVTACGEVGGDTAIARQPVVYGEPSGQVDDAVVFLESPDGICSATLIAPNLVLTARHCIAVAELLDFLRCDLDGTSATDEGLVANDYAPSEIKVVPGAGVCVGESYRAKRLFSMGSPTVCRNDIAVVELEESLDGWPIMPLRLLRPTSVDESMTVVGFGMTEDPFGTAVRRRREGVTVLAVGANRFDANGGQAVAGTFVVSQGPCKGDSGGPAIAETTGAIAGVYSIQATEDCTAASASGIYTQIAEYYELILDAFDAAGAEPWLEGEPAPGTDGDAASTRCSVSIATDGCCGLVLGASFWLVGALRRAARRRRTNGAAPRIDPRVPVAEDRR